MLFPISNLNPEFQPRPRSGVGGLDVRQKIKSIFALLFLVILIPIRAEEVSAIQVASEALRTSKIAKLELHKVTFEQALSIARADWKRQHPNLDFPVSIAEYEQDEQGHPPLITMSLHNVPFVMALKYISQAASHRFVERPGLVALEEVGVIVEDWITKTHPAPEELLTNLGLGKEPTPEQLSSAYAQFSVKLEDWMKVSYNDGFIVVTAFEQQQEQIAGINFLLSKGYKITKGESGLRD
ncbi:MAG: hypothetical protein V4640_07720 [Verrucomicrobiota bacterium]